jgi:hypothetical protein
VRVQRIAALGMFAVWLSACAGSGASPEGSSAHDVPSHEQSASAAPIASASDDPTAACAGVEPDGEPFELAVAARSYAFDTELIEGPRHCQPFVITLTNNDVEPAALAGGTNQHDVDIRAENVLGALVFDGELVNGGGSSVMRSPACPQASTISTARGTPGS